MNDDLAKALQVLKQGGVILYPTDTVWGLGCDATREESVRRICDIKKRADNKSLLVLMADPSFLDRYVEEVPPIAWDLIELSTTPLTIIYPRGKNLAGNLLGTDGSIGIRITSEAFSSELIRRFRKPVVSTSANISGKPSPSAFRDIPEEIKKAVDYIVHYRQGEIAAAKPSSILKLGTGGEVEIIRM